MSTQLSNQSLSETSQLGFGFWFQWIIANAAGFAIGMAIRQFAFGLGVWATSPVVVGTILGASLGLVQIFNLKPYLNKPNWWWVVSNLFGWAAAWVIINQNIGYFVLGLGITQFWIVRGLVAGLIVGTIQWLILRQQYQPASVWIAANIIGWALGMIIGLSIGGAFGWPLVGAVGGVVTGFTLMWLVRRPAVYF